tara:strand:- start:2346 stop:2477 length:132 start_codon:yes stop_codon:yes gene_type:complete
MMSEMTLRIIEGLVLYDLFKIFINLTMRLVFGALYQGEEKDGE